jgi:hypothetical protein
VIITVQELVAVAVSQYNCLLQSALLCATVAAAAVIAAAVAVTVAVLTKLCCLTRRVFLQHAAELLLLLHVQHRLFCVKKETLAAVVAAVAGASSSSTPLYSVLRESDWCIITTMWGLFCRADWLCRRVNMMRTSAVCPKGAESLLVHNSNAICVSMFLQKREGCLLFAAMTLLGSCMHRVSEGLCMCA